ncbi:putative leucine-rich repeat-containing protein DDB_G0290503 [Mytilus trossulus]|uniref:putative leucine-rich repeat-containing protein DDB_G0290503 n=1 Tax=Mytilus trossulus TaxID=6551 RepID=UPI0030057A5F
MVLDNMEKKHQISEVKTDVRLLLECLKCQVDNPSAMKQAFRTLANIFNNIGTDEIKDYFRDLGGLDFITTFNKTVTNVEVKEAAIFCLGCAVENNIYSQKELTTIAQFMNLHKTLSDEKSTMRLKHASSYLLLTLVSNNGLGQSLAKKSLCLSDLLSLLRTSLPSVGKTDCWFDDAGTTGLELWSSVAAALCMCVNNPQNEENQRVCGFVLPYVFTVIQQHDSDVIRPLLSFIRFTVANNDTNQKQVKRCGGLNVLSDKLNQCIGKPIDRLSIQFINTIDACITDNVENAEEIGRLETVKSMVKLLDTDKISQDEKLQIVVTLVHAVEMSDQNKIHILEESGLFALMKSLNDIESGDEELFKAIKYLLQLCTKKTEEEPQNETAEMLDILKKTEAMHKNSGLLLLHKINELSDRLQSFEEESAREFEQVTSPVSCSSEYHVNDLNNNSRYMPQNSESKRVLQFPSSVGTPNKYGISGNCISSASTPCSEFKRKKIRLLSGNQDVQGNHLNGFVQRTPSKLYLMQDIRNEMIPSNMYQTLQKHPQNCHQAVNENFTPIKSFYRENGDMEEYSRMNDFVQPQNNAVDNRTLPSHLRSTPNSKATYLDNMDCQTNHYPPNFEDHLRQNQNSSGIDNQLSRNGNENIKNAYYNEVELSRLKPTIESDLNLEQREYQQYLNDSIHCQRPDDNFAVRGLNDSFIARVLDDSSIARVPEKIYSGRKQGNSFSLKDSANDLPISGPGRQRTTDPHVRSFGRSEGYQQMNEKGDDTYRMEANCAVKNLKEVFDYDHKSGVISQFSCHDKSIKQHFENSQVTHQNPTNDQHGQRDEIRQKAQRKENDLELHSANMEGPLYLVESVQHIEKLGTEIDINNNLTNPDDKNITIDYKHKKKKASLGQSLNLEKKSNEVESVFLQGKQEKNRSTTKPKKYEIRIIESEPKDKQNVVEVEKFLDGGSNGNHIPESCLDNSQGDGHEDTQEQDRNNTSLEREQGSNSFKSKKLDKVSHKLPLQKSKPKDTTPKLSQTQLNCKQNGTTPRLSETQFKSKSNGTTPRLRQNPLKKTENIDSSACPEERTVTDFGNDASLSLSVRKQKNSKAFDDDKFLKPVGRPLRPKTKTSVRRAEPFWKRSFNGYDSDSDCLSSGDEGSVFDKELVQTARHSIQPCGSRNSFLPLTPIHRKIAPSSGSLSTVSNTRVLNIKPCRYQQSICSSPGSSYTDTSISSSSPTNSPERSCPGCIGVKLNSRTFNIVLETSSFTCPSHRGIRQLERQYIKSLPPNTSGKVKRKPVFPLTGNQKRGLEVYDFSSDSNDGELTPPERMRDDLTVPSQLRQVFNGKRRRRVSFTEEEIQNLVNGVNSFGKSWALILQNFEFHESRTQVDLKDKYRGIEKKSGIIRSTPKPGRGKPFSMCEDRRLLRGVKQHGYNWKTILGSSTFSKERTSEDLRNRWRTLHRKHMKL